MWKQSLIFILLLGCSSESVTNALEISSTNNYIIENDIPIITYKLECEEFEVETESAIHIWNMWLDQIKLKINNKEDNSVIISCKEIDSSYVGYWNNYNIILDKNKLHKLTLEAKINRIAHEIGHSLGASHTTSGIMDPVLELPVNSDDMIVIKYTKKEIESIWREKYE
jgi:hypothetical protein